MASKQEIEKKTDETAQQKTDYTTILKIMIGVAASIVTALIIYLFQDVNQDVKKATIAIAVQAEKFENIEKALADIKILLETQFKKYEENALDMRERILRVELRLDALEGTPPKQTTK